MEPRSATEVVSPELALVCPELAARARASLPARPWEAFAPPRPRLRLVPSTPDPPLPVALPVVAGRRAWRPGRGTVLVVLLAVALLVTGLLPARDAPTLRRQIRPSTAEPQQPGPYAVSGGDTFVVEQGGDSLGGFAPPTPCLPAGATLGTPIGPDGSFALTLPIGKATVELAGRVKHGRVAGSYRVRSPGCDSGRVSFTAASP